MSMQRFLAISTVSLVVLAGLAASSARAASPVYKCEADGQVTYQSSPCPSAQPRAQPTVQQLNAERLRRAQASAPAASSPAPDPQVHRGEGPAAAGRYRCDGRQYCSQMTSCAEARYFLANCPGVKMDGDRNGVPCERQWCNR